MTTEIIYGASPVLELLRAGRRHCHVVFTTAGRKEAGIRKVREEAEKNGIPVKTISKEKLSEFTVTSKNQGLAAICDPYPYSTLEEILDEARNDNQKGFILVLDGVSDPQNLGALVRSANLFGVHGVVIPKDNAAPVTPTVVKASAGAAEHQKIVQVTNITNTLNSLKEKGFWIFGADSESSELLYHYNFVGQNTALVLGSEGRGIRRLVGENCDHLLVIPMAGRIGSFNVSAAGAIFMGEVARQRWLSSHAKIVPKPVQKP